MPCTYERSSVSSVVLCPSEPRPLHSECDSAGLRQHPDVLGYTTISDTFCLKSFCPLIRIHFIHKINVEWAASRLLGPRACARRDASTRKVRLTSAESRRPVTLCTYNSSPWVNYLPAKWRDTRPLTEWWSSRGYDRHLYDFMLPVPVLLSLGLLASWHLATVSAVGALKTLF